MSDPIVGTVPSPVITCANCGESIAAEFARVVHRGNTTHHPECPSVSCPECKRPVHAPAIFKINRPGVPTLNVCPWCMADMVEWYRAQVKNASPWYNTSAVPELLDIGKARFGLVKSDDQPEDPPNGKEPRGV